jgi:hypothetical protein
VDPRGSLRRCGRPPPGVVCAVDGYSFRGAFGAGGAARAGARSTPDGNIWAAPQLKRRPLCGLDDWPLMEARGCGSAPQRSVIGMASPLRGSQRSQVWCAAGPRRHGAGFYRLVTVVLGFVTSACANSLSPVQDAPPIYEAQTAVVVASILTVGVLARNPQGYPIRFEVREPCGVTVRLYRAGVRAWDQWTWLQARPGGCKSVGRPVTLLPGEARLMTAAAETGAILGDSLPGGSYQVAGLVWQGSPAPGLVEVPVGPIAIGR